VVETPKNIESVQVQEGRTLEVNCTIVGTPASPNVTWNYVVTNTTSRPVTQISRATAVLKLENIQISDGGLYACQSSMLDVSEVMVMLNVNVGKETLCIVL